MILSSRRLIFNRILEPADFVAVMVLSSDSFSQTSSRRLTSPDGAACLVAYEFFNRILEPADFVTAVCSSDSAWARSGRAGLVAYMNFQSHP